MWFSTLLTMNVPDEEYFENKSRELTLISTFLFHYIYEIANFIVDRSTDDMNITLYKIDQFFVNLYIIDYNMIMCHLYKH